MKSEISRANLPNPSMVYDVLLTERKTVIVFPNMFVYIFRTGPKYYLFLGVFHFSISSVH